MANGWAYARSLATMRTWASGATATVVVVGRTNDATAAGRMPGVATQQHSPKQSQCAGWLLCDAGIVPPCMTCRRHVPPCAWPAWSACSGHGWRAVGADSTTTNHRPQSPLSARDHAERRMDE